jgi:hypothetical protein
MAELPNWDSIDVINSSKNGAGLENSIGLVF